MSPTLYGGGRRAWRRPSRCDCGKIPYRDEAAALVAAELRREEFDTPFRAYKCPGTTRWHLATRGFRSEALKSRPRILAWHLSVRRVISWDGLLREFGLDPSESARSKVAKKLFKTLQVFAELGLVNLDDPRPSYLTAVDYDGLLRVMTVGLQEYAEGRGISVTKPTRDGGQVEEL